MFDITKLKSELNKKQFETVTQIEGPLLIIAGAGSGKTRTITYRMAYMLDQGIHQASILALTFTNKAAREMQERVKKITKKKLSNLTVSTFHAFGVKMLRDSIDVLGYKSNFSIYDQVDKISLIKECCRELKLDPNSMDLYSMANLFSSVKTGRVRWNESSSDFKPIYDEYIEHLKLYNAVDFDDLIVMPILIFDEYPEVLQKYRSRFKYIMVDEFQDTSRIQYRLMKLLAEESKNICVVGDDDQSIYSWRGADYSNILQFEKDFPEVREIKLEQNYRSTGNILEAANTLIANNKNRKEKALWTGTKKGLPIEIYYPDNETKESDFIAEMINFTKRKEELNYHDFGILVRTNSLTTSIEESLLASSIPYKVSGGTSFFQRKEVKDIIAYMKVMANPEDDVNLLRIINTPRRGIGKRTLEQIHHISRSKKCSFFSAITAMCSAGDSPLSDRMKQSIGDFIGLINFFRSRLLTGKKMAQTLTEFVENIDYWGSLVNEYQKNEKLAKWKFKNIQTFIRLFENWENDEDNTDPSLYSYLNRITLITRDDIDDNDEGKVSLMTIHAAKGLEFNVCFLAGIEDQIIPHARSIEEDENNIEEERRLFYVAITRAMKKLFITSCRQRRHMRDIIDCIPSRFLQELPQGLLQDFQVDETPAKEKAKMMFENMNAMLKS